MYSIFSKLEIAIAGAISAMAETIAYAKKNNLDVDSLINAWSSGSAGSWQMKNMAPRALNGDKNPGFFIKHFIKDMKLAEDVIGQDDIVDNYFSEIKCGIIDWVANNPSDGEFALDLLMIAKYLERIGDHATNLAEWVIYSVTGTHKEG